MTFYYIYNANGDVIKKKSNNIECFETSTSNTPTPSTSAPYTTTPIRTNIDIQNDIDNENKTLTNLRVDFNKSLAISVNYNALRDYASARYEDKKRIPIQNDIDTCNDRIIALERELNNYITTNAFNLRNKERQGKIKEFQTQDANEEKEIQDAYNNAIADDIDQKNELKPIKDKYDIAFKNSKQANIDAENAVNTVNTIKTQIAEGTADDLIKIAIKLSASRGSLKNQILNKIKNFNTAKTNEYIERNIVPRQKNITILKNGDANNEKDISKRYNRAIATGIDQKNELKPMKNDFDIAINNSKQATINATNALNAMITTKTKTAEDTADDFIKIATKLSYLTSNLGRQIYDKIDSLDMIIDVNEFNQRREARKKKIKEFQTKDVNEQKDILDAYNNAIADGIDQKNELKPIKDEYDIAFKDSLQANINAMNAVNDAWTKSGEYYADDLLIKAIELGKPRESLKNTILNKIYILGLVKRTLYRQEKINVFEYIIDEENLTFLNEYNKAIADGIDPQNEVKPIKDEYETTFKNFIQTTINIVNAMKVIKTKDDEYLVDKSIITAENLKLVSTSLKYRMINKIKELTIKKQDSDAQAIKDAIALKEINNAIETRNNIRKEDIRILKINENDEKLTLKDAYNKAITDGLNLVDPTDTLRSLQTQYESAFNNFSKTNNDAENAVNLVKTANYKNDVEIDKINKDEKTANDIINNAKKLKLEKDTLKKSLQDAITNFTELKKTAPFISAPFTSAPFTSAPNTSAPNTSISSTPFTPFTSTPYTSAPYTSAPYTSAPYTSAPYTSAPYTSAPYTSAPYTSTPSTSAPYTSTPYTSAPYTSAPYTSAPYTSAPYTSAPYTSAPYTSIPYTSILYTSTPYTSTPNTSVIKETIASENTKGNPPTKASLSKGLIIGGIIFAVLILCLILYFAFFNKNSKGKLETQN